MIPSPAHLEQQVAIIRPQTEIWPQLPNGVAVIHRVPVKVEVDEA